MDINGKFAARPEAFVCYGDYGYVPNFSATHGSESSTSIVRNKPLNFCIIQGVSKPNKPEPEPQQNPNQAQAQPAQSMQQNMHMESTEEKSEGFVSGSEQPNSMQTSMDDIAFNQKANANFSKRLIRRYEEIENYEGGPGLDGPCQPKMRKVEAFVDHEMS